MKTMSTNKIMAMCYFSRFLAQSQSILSHIRYWHFVMQKKCHLDIIYPAWGIYLERTFNHKPTQRQSSKIYSGFFRIIIYWWLRCCDLSLLFWAAFVRPLPRTAILFVIQLSARNVLFLLVAINVRFEFELITWKCPTHHHVRCHSRLLRRQSFGVGMQQLHIYRRLNRETVCKWAQI